MKHYDAVRAEAQYLLLQEYVTHDLGDMVDYRTGEILSERHYHTSAYQPDTTALAPPFANVRSLDALSRFMEHVDRRRLILRNDCRRLFDADKGSHHLKGTDIRLSPAAYRLLSRLADRLDYRNTIVASPASLARWLGVSRANLHRTLGTLGALVRVESEQTGLPRGVIKVYVSPAYGFRYLSEHFGLVRSDAIQDWYQALLQ